MGKTRDIRTPARYLTGLAAGLGLLSLGMIAAQAEGETASYNPLRNAYFGDLHIHTKNSFDAYIFNVRVTPDDAYRYAKGDAITHAAGYKIRLRGAPLDFIAVTDHAEYMGVLPGIADPDNPLSNLEEWQGLISTDPEAIREAFLKVGTSLRDGVWIDDLNDKATMRSAWTETIDAAERHYEPGKFTTFIGYEFTSPPQGANLHRNVIFKDSNVPDLPFSSLDSQNPEDLWAWLDDLREEGIEGLAIPHNSNVSNTLMFQRTDYAGNPIDADYASLRMRNEPIVEMTQVKGTSETHPALSPNDEWADFEIYEVLLGDTRVSAYENGYVRQAYRHGLEMEEASGFNPYKFGMIGASDTHNAGGTFEEERYASKIGVVDGTPENRGSVPPGGAKHWHGIELDEASSARFARWGASGLAGVWAEENTRDSLYAALRRKETFATSGTRLRVRFFAGYAFPDDIADSTDMVEMAYQTGVPMGSDLPADGDTAPAFLVWALRDPRSTWLQRLQIVKGWIEDGASKEAVFDVACSDGLTPDPETNRCPDNGASVDLTDCSFSEDKGDVELRTLWRDPTFEPEQRAFYYVRVLENPTCRWSTWDALRAGVEPNPELPKTIQERAWSSPIWYVPEG